MDSKVYKYMDWPEIEAVVYGEEATPRDLMAPRITADGVLVQGCRQCGSTCRQKNL